MSYIGCWYSPWLFSSRKYEHIEIGRSLFEVAHGVAHGCPKKLLNIYLKINSRYGFIILSHAVAAQCTKSMMKYHGFGLV